MPTPAPIRPPHSFVIPPRPTCRPAPPRAGTLCFWTVFLLFVSMIAFLAILADTRNPGQSLASSAGHFSLEFLLAGCAIAAVIAGIASRNHSR